MSIPADAAAVQQEAYTSRLDHVAGDLSADGVSWRTTKSPLYTNHSVVSDDYECIKLVLTFCQFFVDTVNCIRDNITEIQRTSAGCVFATGSYSDPGRTSLQLSTVERLLSSMPCRPKLSPLDVHPCSLHKSCANVSVAAIVRVVNLSM